MLINAKIPVFVEGGSVPGYRQPRPVVHVVDTVISIAEATSADLPIALRTHRISPNRKRESSQEYRYKDGEFYRLVWEAGEFWLTLRLANPMFTRGKIGVALGEQLSRARKGGHKRRILPGGVIDDLLTYTSSNSDFEKFFNEKSESVLVPSEAEQMIVEAGEAYHRACQDFLLVDGELWEKCPEPVLSVNVRHRPGRMDCLSTTFQPSESFLGSTNRPELDEVLFPVLEYDEAKSLSDRSFDRSAPWPSNEFFLDLSVPEAFSAELPLSEVIGQLDHCALTHDDKKTRKRLTSFLADPSAWSEGRLQEEVENAVATQGQMWKIPALIHQQERFDRKAIHIPMTGPAALKIRV